MRIDQRDNNTAFEAYGRGAASWDHVGSGKHIDNGEWVMLSFTSTSETDTSGFTTRKEFKFYVNGELRNTDSRIGNRFEMNTSQELMIGSNQNGDNNNFKGKMDELRIYKKALSDADINTLYSNSSVQKINATISIPKGQTTGKLEIKGVDDQTDESDETNVNKIISNRTNFRNMVEIPKSQSFHGSEYFCPRINTQHGVRSKEQHRHYMSKE